MHAMSTPTQEAAPKSPLREIVQPFIDLAHAPRALWGINFGNLIEGMVYFGILGYLAMYFNQYVGLDDVWAGRMVGVLTAGITVAMFFLGSVADRWGVRVAISLAFVLLLVGRIVLSAASSIAPDARGLGSPGHLAAMAGILIVVVGYGMYQPAAYAGLRQFTTSKTSGMAFAMYYALMNLGGWLPTFAFLIRDRLGWGISGAFWVYTGFTGVALLWTLVILSRRTVAQAHADAHAARVAAGEAAPTKPAARPKEPFSMGRWLRTHPLADGKFAFFIFCLIPVQTLFAHNWLTLPMYVERAYRGTWLGQNFEVATNFNPILIFILVPIVAALTQKAKVYNMMILGTLVMGAPTFFLALGPSPLTLGGYLVLMTVGEAMWQPRFLQYAAEIAPEGRTGQYMGVAQFPWFLTKLIVPLYSGWFLQRYCPQSGPTETQVMWLVYGCIAMCSTVLLLLARGWIGKDMKTRAA